VPAVRPPVSPRTVQADAGPLPALWRGRLAALSAPNARSPPIIPLGAMNLARARALHTSRMRALAVLAAAVSATLASPTADACSISMEPSAHVFRPTRGVSGGIAGHRPIISLWQTKKPVVITQVKANCIKDTVCQGTSVEYEQVGKFLRPKAALPDGARIQITHDGKLLDDVTITSNPLSLPKWAGVKWVSAKEEKEGLCSPAGPVVRLEVKPTMANLADAYLLVYTTKPDPAKPLHGLVTMFALGAGTDKIEIGNGFGTPDVFKTVPKQIFVRLADGEGNFGPVITLP
jgi:hypothetical protein